MNLSDFDYELPPDLIARYPDKERAASRLLDLSDGLVDRTVTDLPQILRPGDVLVFNDTRVIPARLVGEKETGGRVELLIERITETRRALAHVRASKSPKAGSSLRIAGGATATVVGREGALFDLQFDVALLDHLEAHGEVPLPPYLERDATDDDRDRYQTVYAREPGAVAAPTAGLHFDDPLLAATREAGVNHAFVTLHVGAGTFQSLRHERVEDNRLHAERVVVSDDCCSVISKARAQGGRVVAVGTTAVRSLESAAVGGELRPFEGETDLFIWPGFEFQIVDAVLTNFHLPKSSLMMLVSAFSGRERILAAYAHAVRERYRFFSYGDAMFLTRQEGSA